MDIYVEKPRLFEVVEYNGRNIADIADFIAPNKVEKIGDKLCIWQEYDEVWVAPTQFLVRRRHGSDKDVTVMWPEEFYMKYEALPGRAA